MLNQRKRFLAWAALALVAVWGLALAGFLIAKNARMTAEKVCAYVESVDLSKLSGVERARAIQELADKINRLSREERQRLRLGRTGFGWFDQMTEEEKGAFIEATMPTGFKQALAAFEEMPAEKRQRMVDEAVKRLRETNVKMQSQSPDARSATNRAPVLSEELQMKMRTIGLKTFYSESSAQTKAELAPALEELQRVMESGGRFRGR